MKEQINTEIATGYKMTELGPLPQEWEVVKLGEVANFETGKRMKGGALENGEILSLGGEHIGDFGNINLSKPKFISKKFYDNLSKGKLSVGDVIICKDGAKTGKLAYIKRMYSQYMAVNEHVFIIKSKDYRTLCNSFSFFFLLSRLGQKQVKEAYHGLIGGITITDISNFKLPLPPLPEQRKIAAILSTVQKAIETENKLIERTKELKKSMMHKLFTEGTRGEKQKMTEIGPIPESWEVVRLGDLGDCITGTTPRTSIKDYYQPEEFDFIGPADLGKTKFVYESINKISFKGLSVARVLPKNTVMFVCIGSTIGKTGITYKEISCTNQQINSIICNEKYNFNFVYYLLTFYSNYIKNISSFGPKNILSKGQFIKIKIPVTFDKTEQQQIADMLSTIDQKIEYHTTKKQKLEDLFRTLLHELMTAKIRVDNINLNSLKMED